MRIASMLIIVFGILALATLFFQFKPGQDSDAEHPTNAPLGDPSEQASQALPDEQFDLMQAPRVVIREGQHESGPKLIQVGQGDEVELEFLSDRKAELHLHGYDLVLQLEPGIVATLKFVAAHGGRFEYELHGQTHSGHHALGVIEVMPQ